jgi:hypothetical protein
LEQGAGISGVSGESTVMECVARENGFLSATANATHLVVESRRSSDGTPMDALVLVKPR